MILSLEESLTDLDNREIVEEKFGQPDRVEELQLKHPKSGEIQSFEVNHYHVHRRYSTDVPMGSYHPILLLAEPVLIPTAIGMSLREYAAGHKMRFVYDEDGETIGFDYPYPFTEHFQMFRKSNVLRWEQPEDAE